MRIVVALLLGILVAPAAADDPIRRSKVHVDRIVIDDAFPDAYQVEVVDVDGDKKPDIVALGGSTIAWYQNPTWTKRIIAAGNDPLKADIISSATTDLDGDGRAEIAIACDFAMPTPSRGQLWLATQGETPTAPWALRKIADVPSIHRVRWGDVDGDGKPELIVAPIFGPGARPPTYDQDPARVVEFRLDSARPKTGAWTSREIMRRPVVHAVAVVPQRVLGPPSKQPVWVVTADNTGISVAMAPGDRPGYESRWEVAPTPMILGASGPAPKRGCSDFNACGVAGQLPIFVTIEPWHGSELVAWKLPESEDSRKPFLSPLAPTNDGRRPVVARTVIDATLDDGHALWTADVDGDGTDEIFAGHRGKDHRVAMYRLDGASWARTILDSQIAAQDLRGGDIDGDGVPDIVGVGGTTHNVVWYHPTRLKGAEADASIR